MTRTSYLSIALLAAALHVPAYAQGILDEQLGPKAPSLELAPPAQPAVTEQPKPATRPAAAPAASAPRAPEIISPNAAKAVDDQDLIRELTQPGSDKPDPQKVEERIKAMLARMQDSAELLKNKKDPGDLTQETQRRIVMDLDVMIQLALQQQQQQQQSGPPQPGQQRQPGQPQPGQPGPGQQQGGSNPATDDENRGGQNAATPGDMRDRSREGWGGLPPRDRDEIAHGANEEYLSIYKGMIDRYYQALAELGKKGNR
jgi:hypothetical protein